MSYREWWSLPSEEVLSVTRLRRLLAAALRIEGLRMGIGYVPCQPEVIAPSVEDGRVDLFFCVTPARVRAVADALDEDLAELLQSELRALEREAGTAERGLLTLSLHAQAPGWEGPRMLLTDEAEENQRYWPLACILGHVLARMIGATLILPDDDWPLWDPDAVLTIAS